MRRLPLWLSIIKKHFLCALLYYLFKSGIILGTASANEGWRYIVMLNLIGCAHTQNESYNEFPGLRHRAVDYIPGQTIQKVYQYIYIRRALVRLSVASSPGCPAFGQSRVWMVHWSFSSYVRVYIHVSCLCVMYWHVYDIDRLNYCFHFNTCLPQKSEIPDLIRVLVC